MGWVPVLPPFVEKLRDVFALLSTIHINLGCSEQRLDLFGILNLPWCKMLGHGLFSPTAKSSRVSPPPYEKSITIFTS